MNELALFAGAGGGILGGHLLGWRTVCAVEWEPYAACVLAARQNDGILPPFPIWDDVQTFDGRPWRGIVDVVSGGFPCQDISAAGKGAGIDGERSGMWSHMARIVGEVRPKYVFVENSPILTSRGLHRVLGDLASLGFDARWGVVSAADVGAPHKRDRIWILAYSTQLQRHGSNDNARVCLGRESAFQFRNHCGTKIVADASEVRSRNAPSNGEVERNFRFGFSCVDRNWWAREPESTPRTTEPNVGQVAHGVAARVDRLKAIGNGQVPLVAATAWRLLNDPA